MRCRIKRPCPISRAAADADDAAQAGAPSRGQALVGKRLDRCDAFEKALEETIVLGRTRIDPCLKAWIGDREALSRFWQRIVIEAGRLLRPESGRQTFHFVCGKMHQQRRATRIGSAAGKPAPPRRCE